MPIDTLTVDLKPCPFCGGVGYMRRYDFTALPSTYSVACRKCRAQTWTFFATKDEAAEAWNGRENEK